MTGPAPYSSPVRGTSRPSIGGTSFVEVVGVWGVWGLAAIAVFVTYSRISAQDLYNVSASGLEGGAGRALVFLGYPIALVALAVLLIVFERLEGAVERSAALVSAGLSATIVIPGVVDQSDLDARPVNALAAIGVGTAVALTVIAIARCGLGEPLPVGAADAVRLAIAAVLLVAALPWLAAELGFYIDAVAPLDPVFMSEELYRDHGEAKAAVHLGDHHGTDGVLLAWTALALSRVVPTMRALHARRVLTAYLALMLVYGLALALEDFWLEQLVKRDVTSIRLPNMIRPDLSPAWGAILAVTAVLAVFAVLYGRRSEAHRSPPSGA